MKVGEGANISARWRSCHAPIADPLQWAEHPFASARRGRAERLAFSAGHIAERPFPGSSTGTNCVEKNGCSEEGGRF